MIEKRYLFTFLIMITLIFSLLNPLGRLNASYSGEIFITVPDDVPSINMAIPKVREGGTVKIKRGNYAETVYINKSVTLLGENNPTIRMPLTITHTQNVTINGISFVIEPAGTEPAIIALNASRLTLENLKINATFIFLIDSADISIKNCQFAGNPGPSIHIQGKKSNNITIEWCKFNQTYMALVVRQATNINFRYNTVNATEFSIKLLSECKSATISLNNFLKGEAEDYGIYNKWYNETSKLGNHWADLDPSKDKNEDGIIDEPKTIGGTAGSRDEYPLAKPFTEYLKSQNQQANITTYITAAIALIATLTAAATILYMKRRQKIEQK